MPNIFIRDIPEELYRRFEEVARRDHRSIPGEVLYMMEKEVTGEAYLDESRAALARLSARRRAMGRLPVTAAELVRESRDEE